MSEFLNRIDLQREVIKMMNESDLYNFQISGLSVKAIDRWKNENNIGKDDDVYLTLIKIADKLFFLSNKSQEQITDDYKSLSKEVYSYVNQLAKSLKIIN